MPPAPSGTPHPPLAPPVGRRIPWGQVASGAAAILGIALLVRGLGQSQNVLWGEIPRYLVDPRVVAGTAWVTGANADQRHAFGVVAGRDDLQREGEAQQDKADAQREAAKKEAEAESARAAAKANEERQKAEQ